MSEPARVRVVSSSEEGTIALGRALGAVLRPGDVVAIEGELGAGKTRLVRGIAEGMGLDPGVVCSPTFVMMNHYERGGVLLVHVDAYRLSGAEELDTLGWDTLPARAVVAVEWPRRIEGALAPGAHVASVRITPGGGPQERVIEIECDAAWRERAGWAAVEACGRGWTRCPVTGKAVPPDSPTYPFADQRAKMADLGRWFGEGYRVSREVRESDREME